MTEKKRIVFVVNPISGTQGKKAILKWMELKVFSIPLIQTLIII